MDNKNGKQVNFHYEDLFTKLYVFLILEKVSSQFPNQVLGLGALFL